jgi:uncharacterized membrane protein/ribosomal protein L40E
MSLESNKTLGGIGAILLAIPFLNLIGIILILIAMKGMGEYYNDDNIFKNALYGFIFGIVGVIALIAVILMFVVGYTATSQVITTTPSTTFAITGLGLFILAFIVLYVFSLIGAIFYKKSLDILSEKSNESMFGTAGLILLIGAAIPVIGEILKFLAWILAAVGFFNIRVSKQVPTQKEEVPKSVEKRFCTYCGASITPEAIYCQKCGKKIE